MATPRPTAPATPVLAVSCRMLRSPSHESVTTDLSLFSVSSVASEAVGKHRVLGFREQRGPSPNPDTKHSHSRYFFRFNGLSYCLVTLHFSELTFGFLYIDRPADIPEVTWFEDGNELIRSCALLSSALGTQKSFSTSDIAQLPLPESQSNQLRQTVSELALNSLQRCGYMLDHPRLDHTSRSCSTWVAVGELATTSQLPSPHGGPANPPALTTSTPPPPTFTAADLIRSVNKKVRQNYIRRRLLTTYRALERLSQSEFNLDRLEAAAVAASITSGPGPTELIVPTNLPRSSAQAPSEKEDKENKGSDNSSQTKPTETIETKGQAKDSEKRRSHKLPKAEVCEKLKRKISLNVNKNLTLHDIDRERGKPLSKYERNMMIFNWLHSLDETSTVEDMP